MPKRRTEEQFPLLLVLVGDEEVERTNRRFLGRGRFGGITTGASAIITEWPNYLSSCWITALICGVALFTISLMLSSCMTLEYNHRLPRCSPTHLRTFDNTTVHLVHTAQNWTPDQLRLVHAIARSFPSYTIHLVLINGTTRSRPPTNTTATVGDDAAVAQLRRNVTRLQVSSATYGGLFDRGPLFFSWLSMNEAMKVFAVRVLQLWQHGGLSFDLLERLHGSRNGSREAVEELVRRGKERYERMEAEGVSADANGLHMESKLPCHAFFEKVLRKLRRVGLRSTPRGALSGALYTFCKTGTVDSEFCPSKNNIVY